MCICMYAIFGCVGNCLVSKIININTTIKVSNLLMNESCKTVSSGNTVVIFNDFANKTLCQWIVNDSLRTRRYICEHCVIRVFSLFFHFFRILFISQKLAEKFALSARKRSVGHSVRFGCEFRNLFIFLIFSRIKRLFSQIIRYR